MCYFVKVTKLKPICILQILAAQTGDVLQGRCQPRSPVERGADRLGQIRAEWPGDR